MFSILFQMAILILCGAAWRVLRPQDLDADTSRAVLTTLVYYLLLPALVLEVMWRAPVNINSARIAATAAGVILLTAPLAWGIYRWLLRQPKPVVGALVLASVFPNATYLGLPVLENAFGEFGRRIAIQYDLLACTPLLLSGGILFAQAHGEGETAHPLRTISRIPALWALLIGVSLAGLDIAPPAVLTAWLKMLGGAVVPLMLIAVGMGLRWNGLYGTKILLSLPALAIQLFLMPYLAWQLAWYVGLQGKELAAVVLESAMPSMVLGIVLCDRYRLDSSLYAVTVTLSTFTSLFTLPLWFEWVGK